MKRLLTRKSLGPFTVVPFTVVLLLPVVAIGSLHLFQRNSDVSNVSVVRAQQGDLLSAVTATGTVQERRTVDVKYDTQSLVTGLNVKEGDHVAVNQLVATMDLRLLEQPSLGRARRCKRIKRVWHSRRHRFTAHKH